MYHQLLKRTFFLMTLCGSVMLSAGDDAWSKSGSHYSYTRTGKIAPEFLPDGGIKYTFSLGCPEYPFDAGTGSCTPGDLKYSGNATRGPASGVTGTVEYGKDELPASDTSMSMSGKLIPPEGTEGSQPTWSASATLQSPFWLEASPSNMVKAGTAVTITAKGDPTESTWTIDNTAWKNGGTDPVETSSVTLNRNMWDQMRWTSYPIQPEDLFPPAGAYSVAATTTEEKDARSADIIVYVFDLGRIKFAREGWGGFREVDRDYKMIASFSGKRCSFAIDIIPSTLPEAEKKISWSGPIAGDTIEVTGTISSGSQTASFKSISKSVTVVVRSVPTGDTDTAYALKHPIDTATASYHGLTSGTGEAYQWAKSAYPGDQLNTRADAARHAYWNCLLVRYVSSAYATGVATGHEVGSTIETETIMDLHNNEIGRGLAGHTHGSDNTCCQNAVRAAVSSGQLWYLDDAHGRSDTDGTAFLQPTDK